MGQLENFELTTNCYSAWIKSMPFTLLAKTIKIILSRIISSYVLIKVTSSKVSRVIRFSPTEDSDPLSPKRAMGVSMEPEM